MTTYWQEHQVGGPYHTLEESEAALAERERLFPFLYGLMPVKQPGKTVLDYGCGPGHDTILFLKGDGFHRYGSGARDVWFADVSDMAIEITSQRLSLYGIHHKAWPLRLPRELPEVDHVHCAGVLHHTEDPVGELKSLREALREGGEARIMVYDGELSTHSQSDVPITEWWTPAEFIDLCVQAGWDGRNIQHVGSYPCSAEWRPNCYAACFKLT